MQNLFPAKIFTGILLATAAYNKNEIVSVTSDQFHGSAIDVTRVAEDISYTKAGTRRTCCCILWACV